MSKFSVSMKMVVRSGRGDELEAALAGVFRQIEDEPGTEIYLLNRSAQDPDVFFSYEVFRSKADFDAHCATDTVRALRPVLAELIASSEITQGTPVRGRGLAG
jgi:(4S)-4-hydroxy-5-phosphonooxypentane-2,3-dione isomerase